MAKDWAKTAMNAKKERSQKVVTSYGFADHFLRFLEPQEALKLQELNQFWYNIAISRVIMTVRLPVQKYFTFWEIEDFSNVIFEYTPIKNSVRKIHHTLSSE